MQDHYFTFGFGQPNQGGYHVISANTEHEAVNEMFRRFGSKWAFRYDSAEAAGVKEFNLKKIEYIAEDKECQQVN